MKTHAMLAAALLLGAPLVAQAPSRPVHPAAPPAPAEPRGVERADAHVVARLHEIEARSQQIAERTVAIAAEARRIAARMVERLVPPAPDAVVAPAPWLSGDPGDSLYRAARSALNGRQYAKADSLFGQLRARYPGSGYVPDSYYFQAFALQRQGGRERENAALELLVAQLDRYPNAATTEDAVQLKVRLMGVLAQRGDPRAAAAVESAARANCEEEDQELRATALSALVSMDEARALPILKEILRGRDACSAQLRRQAVLLLARMDGPAPVDLLLDAALRNPDPDPGVRAQAISWLTRIDSPEATAGLEALLGKATERVELVQVLAPLGASRSARNTGILERYVRRDDVPSELRADAMGWLAFDARNGGAAFLRAVYPTFTDPVLKEGAIGGVARSTSEEDRAWLRERVMDEREPDRVRRAALSLGARLLAVPDLRALYAEVADRGMRMQILGALAQQDGPEALDALIGIARTEPDRELRKAAVASLSRSDDPRAADLLMEVIEGRPR